MRKILFFMLLAIMPIAVKAQSIKKVTPGILCIGDVDCTFKMAFGEIAIEKKDTLCHSFFNKQGSIIYEVLSYKSPALSAVELGIDPNDIESAMTHDLNYSSAPSKKYTRFYRYNASNQIESIYTFTYEGKLTQLRLFSYDKFGISVEDVYDAQNILMSKIKYKRSVDGKKIDRFVYNGDGDEQESDHYELDAVGDTILQRGWLSNIHFTYDKSHHRTSKYVVKDEKTMYKYDSHGNCVLEYPYMYGAFSKSWVVGYPQTKYEYEYDDKGNWITKKTYDVQTDVMSNLDKITKRFVVYPGSPEQHEQFVSKIENVFNRCMMTLKGQ